LIELPLPASSDARDVRSARTTGATRSGWSLAVRKQNQLGRRRAACAHERVQPGKALHRAWIPRARQEIRSRKLDLASDLLFLRRREQFGPPDLQSLTDGSHQAATPSPAVRARLNGETRLHRHQARLAE
jgi:hypothetical protein